MDITTLKKVYADGVFCSGVGDPMRRSVFACWTKWDFCPLEGTTGDFIDRQTQRVNAVRKWLDNPDLPLAAYCPPPPAGAFWDEYDGFGWFESQRLPDDYFQQIGWDDELRSLYKDYARSYRWHDQIIIGAYFRGLFHNPKQWETSEPVQFSGRYEGRYDFIDYMTGEIYRGLDAGQMWLIWDQETEKIRKRTIGIDSDDSKSISDIEKWCQQLKNKDPDAWNCYNSTPEKPKKAEKVGMFDE